MDVRDDNQVADLYETVALMNMRRPDYESNQHAVFDEAGIDHGDWMRFQLSDIMDTLSNLASSKKGNMVALDGTQIATTIATHARMAFEVGFRLGKGQIP